jgi:hypothetical protein
MKIKRCAVHRPHVPACGVGIFPEPKQVDLWLSRSNISEAYLRYNFL